MFIRLQEAIKKSTSSQRPWTHTSWFFFSCFDSILEDCDKRIQWPLYISALHILSNCNNKYERVRVSTFGKTVLRTIFLSVCGDGDGLLLSAEAEKCELCPLEITGFTCSHSTDSTADKLQGPCAFCYKEQIDNIIQLLPALISFPEASEQITDLVKIGVCGLPFLVKNSLGIE